MRASSYISPKARKGGPSGVAGRVSSRSSRSRPARSPRSKGGHVVDTAALDALPEKLRNSDIQRSELQQRLGPNFSWYLRRRFDPAAGGRPSA